VYQALETASDLLALRNEQAGAASYPDARALFAAYTETLYRFDQLYRHFCESADYAEANDWDILKSLRSKIENVYSNSFLADLALQWKQAPAGWTFAAVADRRHTESAGVL